MGNPNKNTDSEDWVPVALPIPPHWVFADIEDVLENLSLNNIKIPQKDYLSSGKYPVIDQGAELIGGYTNSQEKVIESDRSVIIFGDHTKCFKYVSFPFAPGADGIKVLRPRCPIDEKFAYYACRSLRLPDRGYSRHYSFLKRSKFPLPPVGEQRRIVAKIEELYSELDNGIESLKTAREQLNVYRQAVLKHAFEGKLTEQWREEHKDKLRTGDNLRTEIMQKRRAEWEQAELQKFEEKGTIPKNDRWKERYKEPFEFEVEELPDLPEAWCWISLDELVSGRPRSMQSGPFGSNLKHDEFQPEGILVLGIDNVLDGGFSMGSQNRISEAKFEELAKYEARPGDLLITVMASLGRTCVVPRDLETAIITKHVYRISMNQNLLLPEFYNLLLQTETVSRRRMFKSAQGQTRPGLNSMILRGLPVPLCSLDEQQEIVMRLSEDLSRIERIESVIDEQLQRSGALRQSILRRAFSGQLVDQDPNDEPASVFLERIMAEKAAQKRNNKNNNKRKDAA